MCRTTFTAGLYFLQSPHRLFCSTEISALFIELFDGCMSLSLSLCLSVCLSVSLPPAVSPSPCRTELENGELSIVGTVHSLDGAQKAQGECAGTVSSGADADALGRRLADILRSRGAGEILAAIPRQLETPTTKPTARA